MGVYIDGFNLYYGARGLCGRGTTGWRWLDVRNLSQRLLAGPGGGWTDANITRVVYCTARVSGRDNPSGATDQALYLRALNLFGSVDELSEGSYVSRVARAPLATPDRKGRPVLSTASWPVMIKDSSGAEVADATFMASVARREEKGSDVNVASHLLIDILEGNIDAAIVVSNDSDLAFPVTYARSKVHVGLVNPTKGYPAGALNGDASDGVGSHWWHQLTAAECMSAQLPAQVGSVRKPAAW